MDECQVGLLLGRALNPPEESVESEADSLSVTALHSSPDHFKKVLERLRGIDPASMKLIKQTQSTPARLGLVSSDQSHEVTKLNHPASIGPIKNDGAGCKKLRAP